MNRHLSDVQTSSYSSSWRRHTDLLLPIELWVVPVQPHGILKTAFTLEILFDTFPILEAGVKSLEEQWKVDLPRGHFRGIRKVEAVML